MNDPLRVAREGPFWASMFVVLGAVVGFGGTIEVSIYFMEGSGACYGPPFVVTTVCRADFVISIP